MAEPINGRGTGKVLNLKYDSDDIWLYKIESKTSSSHSSYLIAFGRISRPSDNAPSSCAM